MTYAITLTHCIVIWSDTCDYTHTVYSNLPRLLCVFRPSEVTHVIAHKHPVHGNQCNQIPISAVSEVILSWLILESEYKASEQCVLFDIKD